MHFAFLRSINVGGRRVKNAELVALFEGLGLSDVAAYQAAGNLAFRGDADAARLQHGLSKGLGYDVPVLLRSAEELVALVENPPFGTEEIAASKGKLQVLLLEQPPASDVSKELAALETPTDALRLQGSELYWLPEAGVGGTTLELRRLERLLGLQTCRTHGTLQRMARKFCRAG